MANEEMKDLEIEVSEADTAVDTAIDETPVENEKDFEKLYNDEKKLGTIKAAVAAGGGFVLGILWIKKMFPGLKRIIADHKEKRLAKKAAKLAEKQAMEAE